MRRLLALVVLLAPPLLAQAPHAALTGTARSARRGVAGVTVTISSASLQGTRTTTTVANGDYFFDALPPGTYDIRFAKKGYATVTHRGVLMLAQTARVDAELSPSQEEESITATGTSMTVLETPEIATTLDWTLIERLPVRRALDDRLTLAPGDREFFFDPILVDAARLGLNRPMFSFVEDSIDQTTILSGALTPEWGSAIGGSLLTVTKSGGNDFSGSLRDTITSDVWHARSIFAPGDRSRRLNHSLEATFGGRLVPDRVWFFLSAGYVSLRTLYDESGNPIAFAASNEPVPVTPLRATTSREQAKITVAPTTTATVVASALHAQQDDQISLAGLDFRPRSPFETGSIDGTSMAGPRGFIEALAGESRFRVFGGSADSAEQWLVRAGWLVGGERFGSHEITVGDELSRATFFSRDAATFANEHWHLSAHWSFNLGVRYDSFLQRITTQHPIVIRGKGFQPRLAAMFDVHGDGHSRWSFSHDRYFDSSIGPMLAVQEDTLAYAMQIGGNGFVRVDGWNRRWATSGYREHGLEMQGSYRFLGLLEAGGNYTWMTKRYFFEPNLHDHANLWLQTTVPVPHGAMSAAVLEQYLGTAGRFASSAATTGVDVTYAIPVARTTLFAKGDLMNAFDRRAATPREFRLGLGARY